MATKQVSTRDRLFRDLTAGYNASLNPDPTELTFGLTPRFISYDKAAGELTTQVWEFLSWKDSRLSWNPTDYDGVKTLRIPARHLWIPDTKLYNSVPAIVDRDADVNTLVSSDGTVLWIPIANYRTRAEEQANGEISSKVKVGSWTFNRLDVALKLRSSGGFDLSFFDAESPYSVASSTAKIEVLEFDKEEYPAVIIDFSVKRR
jgi:hypothetical protein